MDKSRAEMLEAVQRLYHMGCKDKDIARAMNRSTETVKKYRHDLGLSSIENPKTEFTPHHKNQWESPEQTDLRVELYGDQRYDRR